MNPRWRSYNNNLQISTFEYSGAKIIERGIRLSLGLLDFFEDLNLYDIKKLKLFYM